MRLRTGVFCAFAFLPAGALADRMISWETVLDLAPEMRNSSCRSDCEINGLSYVRVDLPADIVIGDREAFRITATGACGSAGCASAIVAIGSDDVHYLADGFNLSVQSLRLKSVSDETLVTLRDSPQSAPRAQDAVAAANFKPREDGVLCDNSRSPLATSDLKGAFWGTRIDGINTKGETWSEYLARGADASHTIFVNADGKETIGFYRIANDQICFSYGIVGKWRCKTVSVCLSGEADYVITDLEGKQTSLITSVEPHGWVLYHKQRWDSLAAEQPLKVPVDPSAPRTFTALPESFRAAANEVARALSRSDNMAFLDRSTCRLSIISRKPIMKKVLSAGGWSDWMGSTTGGEKKVGESTRTVMIDLEKLDVGRIQDGQDGWIHLLPSPGFTFVEETQHRRTDTTLSLTSEVGAFPGMAIPVANPVQAQMAAMQLKEMIHACRRMPLEPAVAASGQASTPPTRVRTAAADASVTGQCAAIENDIARLECFDNAMASYRANTGGASGGTEGPTTPDTLRAEVAAGLLRHEAIVAVQSKVWFLDGAFKAAIQQGLVTSVLEHLGPGPRGNSWEAAVTPAGRSRGIASATPRYFSMESLVPINLEVTGMTDTSTGQDRMQVEFKWSYSSRGGVIERFAQRGGTGRATMRLWDEGWRADEVSIEGNKLRFSLSQNILDEINADIAQTATEGGPWYYVKRQGTFIPVRDLK